MALAKITLIGLDQYTNGSIWKNFTMPEGIDAEAAKMEIMKACGEFPLLYTDADFVAGLIGHICTKWKASFIRWQAVSVAQYNALYNVDADITITDESTEKGSNKSEGTGKSVTSGSIGGTATNKVAAYDSNTFQNRDENTISNTNSSQNDIENTDSSEYENTKKLIHTEARKGNIGVTKSQDLLLSEIDLWRWNMYEEIADIFVTELTIPVYS